ncbi:MAG: DUF1353 domain-containing protein [Epsilonproteobacteria bacterium]|nr:DUF1353 domain-containing protein [Campylobacterota bacterium]
MFVGNVILDHIEGTENSFVVKSNFVYISERYRIEVRAGLETDGASVPRIFWNIVPPVSGRYLEAAVLHDALYASKLVNRKEADEIFLEAMKDLGVAAWKRYIMYWAVRVFGEKAWESHDITSVAKARRYVEVSKLA